MYCVGFWVKLRAPGNSRTNDNFPWTFLHPYHILSLVAHVELCVNNYIIPAEKERKEFPACYACTTCTNVSRTNVYVMTYSHAKTYLSVFFQYQTPKATLLCVFFFFLFPYHQHVPRHVVFVLLILILLLRSSSTKWARALPWFDPYAADVNVIYKINKRMNKLTCNESILCFGCHLLSLIILLLFTIGSVNFIIFRR